MSQGHWDETSYHPKPERTLTDAMRERGAVARPDIEARLEKLEKDSHPPMPYVVCSTCRALVRDEDFHLHHAWHRRLGPIRTPNT